ncbi:hypothetical protein [Mesorhizobium sp. J428]|uniref:hypothetical protein n=1 Tax=Mesorhizobium sp. J428 TaxID=2898440 RepID=UPI0027E37A27|nr:hypothetical protein [Mesorhizobium sp. J428]
MKHQIDPGFRQRKQSFAAWKRQARLRRIYMGVAGLVLCAAGATAYLVRDNWMPRDDLDEELQVTEGIEDLPSDAQVYVPAIVDLPGDPMWITLSHDPTAVARNRVIDRPDALAESGVPAKLEALTDEMLSSSEQFMTTIPSNQEDFAFFQAQRSGATVAVQEQQDQPAIPAGEMEEDAGTSPDADLDAGWDDLQQGDGEALPTFKKTEIENNTTVATVVQEAQRFEATEDTFVRILGTRTLESVALDARFSREDASLASAALKSVFGREQLEQGFVVAMRGYRPRRDAPSLSLMQVSVYARNTYVGTLVRGDSGGFEAGVDPWVSNDLFNYSGLPDQDTLKRQYRLLDAIYSTAVRNNVPPRVIGEAIMHLSRGNDLNLFADESDRLVLIYSQEPRSKDKMTGRVLYVATWQQQEPRLLRLSAAGRRVHLCNRRRSGPVRGRRERHGDAGQRSSHIDVRAAQAPHPQDGAAAQGRRLEGPRRVTDLRGLRRAGHLSRRQRRIRQSGQDLSRRRA